MLSKTEKIFLFIFLIILVTELLSGSQSSLQTLHYFAKPALIISLIAYFWKNSEEIERKVKKYLYSALCFSLIGDVLLMFDDENPSAFIAGLIAFLLAHIFYVIVFNQSRNRSKNPMGFIFFLLIYASGLFYLLKNGLGDLLIPVIIYMLVILTMSTSAFLRQGSVNAMSYNLVLLGAILFMISDSLLALNKFYKPILYPNISIMLTYALAQFCIVIGILKQR